jgi:hypothetical protein
MVTIRIAWKSGEVTASLRDTPDGRALLAALPCESRASTWGDEVYFSLPVAMKLDADARQVVAAGDVCYWVQGNALALPFGPTPISRPTSVGWSPLQRRDGSTEIRGASLPCATATRSAPAWWARRYLCPWLPAPRVEPLSRARRSARPQYL